MAGATGPNQRLKVEDALSYLDQVKLQFGSQPQVYNQFLEIMKEFKSQSIDTPGVIRRVQELFEGHNDLIVGFNTFLPPGFKIEMPEPQVAPPPPPEPGQSPAPPAPAAAVSTDPQLEFNHAINYVNKIKTRFSTQLDVYKSFLEILHTYQKEQRTISEVYQQVAALFVSHPDLLEEFSQFLPEAVPAAEAHQQATRQQQARATLAPRVDKKPVRAAEAQPAPKRTAGRTDVKLIDFAESVYFERVKKALRSETAYDNFLRCLNLYSHEIVNKTDLVLLLTPFLGPHPELMSWFKTYIAYKEDPSRPEGIGIDAAGRPDLAQCKRLDKSYRELPPQHAKVLCTGREKLRPEIAETLNDTWVSFPAWSEDSTFFATKKNAYEEAIFRCEDERFELDVVLEVNLCAIRQLERVMKEIEALPGDQQKEFRLNTKNMHGPSEVLYRKAISRLYGDKSEDVFQAMKRDPLTAVPIVLRRLKQKQQEWRAAHRQWNRVWRDTNERNYLKSLDYKVALFKRQDPLACKPKTLKQNLKDRCDAYRAYRASNEPGREPVPPPVMTFDYKDPDLFHDVNRLLLYTIARGSFGADRSKMETLLQHFLPEYFFMEPFALPAREDDEEVTGDKENSQNLADDAMDADAGSPITTPAAAAAAAAANAAAAAPAAAPAESAAPAAPAPVVVEDPIAAMMTRVQRQPSSGGSHLFYGNGKWFGFHALYQILYERVLEIKELSMAVAARKAQADADETAADLNLHPAVALAMRTAPDTPMDRYYDAFMDSTEKFLSGQMEGNAYEESMRELFTIKAYKIFTIDKLIQTTARQLQAVAADAVSQALSGAYLKSLQPPPGYDYKTEVLSLLENSSVFRIEQPTPRHLVMELLDSDLTGSDGDSKTKWMRYVERYVRLESTDPHLEAAINVSKRPIFLKRNVTRTGFTDATAAMSSVVFNNLLECKICMNTYKMYFVIKSEDFFFRPHRADMRPIKRSLATLLSKATPPDAPEPMRQ